MNINTHQLINASLCGTPLYVENGESRVEMTTVPTMAVDDKGLVHGGFVFGLADYAAMIAVNHPHVVLGAASARFIKPVSVGQLITAEAKVEAVKGKKHIVKAVVKFEEQTVFEAEFTCFVLEKHVLS